jgi:hypothetical protein
VERTVRLRRAVELTVAANVIVFAALAVLFGALVEPPEQVGSCTTGLPDGAYADALAPAFLAAFAALAAVLAWLSAQRSRAGRPGRATLVALAVAAVFALGAVARHELLDWPGLLALIFAAPVGFLAAAAALAHTLVVLRSERAPERRWERHAALAQAAAWLMLVVGLPAALAAAWVNAAGLFCF